KGSKAELDVVRLDYEQADLDLKRLQSDLSKMTIHAPTQGLVLCNENWQSGRKFQKGDTVWDGFPLVSLPDLTEIQVLAYVHNQDFPRLRNAAAAEVVLDSTPARVYPAVLTSLPQAATPYRPRSELKVFRVLFDVRETDTSAFKPGMTARVRVPVTSGSGLLVPRIAVTPGSRDQGSVRVRAGNSSSTVAVRIVQANEQEVLVEGNLKDGQELLPAAHDPNRKRGTQEDWITVKKEDLTFGVSGSGQLQAAQAVEIRPPNLRDFHRFKIASMVEEGKQVKQGEPILDFDKSEVTKRLTDENASLAKVKEEREKTQASLEVQRKDLELQLEEARVQKEKAVNKLTEAREFESNLKVKTAEYEAEYATNRVEMLEKKMSAVNRHADLQLKILNDRIAFYQNRVKLANDGLEALSIKAPTSGVVIYKPNWNNEKKQVGSDCWTMETIMTLPDLNTLLIEGQVAEVDAGKVKVGQRISASLDAIPDRTFEGEISEVSTIFTEASFDRPIKVLQIKAKLDGLDLKRMRPGMVTRLEIIVDRVRNVLAVPLSVIEVEGGRSFVRVKKGDQVERRAVQLGKNNGIVAVVSSGLAEGEQVAGKRPEAETTKSSGG
ncbi:MAG: HlyD family efflux transporter periplasmic adaptor subunit, partial [Acidobacteria bacterium]